MHSLKVAFFEVLIYFQLLGYVLLGRVIISRLRGLTRDVAFALLNLYGLYLFFFAGIEHGGIATYVCYLALILLQYLALRMFATRTGSLPWLAFSPPILALILIRYLPWKISPLSGVPNPALFVGISYLAFRSSYLALEVRNGVVPCPNLFRYIGFCFFVPTISVGPINPYSNHHRAFESEPVNIDVGRASLRILIGMIKYRFLGNICFQMTYSNLLLDGHHHPWIDLPVAMIFYYLFLFCNFSGFCDIAIGGAGLMGIPVAENFNDPFAARNVKDFWNRWHITLSVYMRDVVFAPLSKFLVRLGGPAMADHAIAVTIGVVFLLVGVWHGVGWNFAAFGAAHALGVIANHYYTIFLKKRLGRERLKAYNANRSIHWVAVALTFCYCAATLFLFANTFAKMKTIFAVLQ